MKKPTVLYNLTDIQKQYLGDFSHRFFVIPPGRRSRKTLIGTAKIHYCAMNIPDTNYFMAAPTSQQAKRIFWEKLKRDMKPFAQSTNNTDLILTLRNGSKITVAGLDKPERLEGSPWDGGCITETGNTKPNFWGEHLRPSFADTARAVQVNDTKNKIDTIQLGFCIFDGTPEGRNHYYDMALQACNGIIPQTEPIKGAYADFEDWAFYHWFSSDVLPAVEIEAMRRDMDERTFKQEAEGEFVTYEGTLYYNFSADNINNEIAQYYPDEPIYLSCDFNKNPMSWGIGQKRNRRALVVDEITIQYNAKTQQAAEMFCERYKKANNRLVYLTGDASGKVETTRDYSTDYLIIEDVLKRNNFQVSFQVPNYNPNINNRVNLACSLLKSITGERRCYINEKCVFLKNDLERNTGDGKGGKDKSDPQQTHASDWFDYLITCMFQNEFWGSSTGQAKI